MDDLDKRIMAELIKDAEIPLSQIAKQLGTSAETVRKRFQRMQDDNMILHSSVSVDFRKLGFEGFLVLMLTSQDVQASIMGLRRTKNVIAVNRTVGEHDLMVFLLVRDINDLIDVVNRVRKVDRVDAVKVIVCRLTAPFPTGTIIHRLEEPLLKDIGRKS